VGDHLGDDAGAVAENRARVATSARLPGPEQWVWIDQVHGRAVVEVDAPPVRPPTADASVTTRPGLPLAIVTADCAPVVLANDTAIGLVHAGHRGLAGGVLHAAVERVRARGEGPLRAFLGPCIRAECYEFSAGDLAPFVARFGAEVESRTRTGAPALDLAAGVRIALGEAGIDALDDCGVCTADADDLYSYRRDGTTGRQVTVAVLARPAA
jgi:YfiH family protein